jgi:Zn-dependent peptidase ImmA (M78 family)
MNYREARKIARKAEHAFGLPNDATFELIHEKLEQKRGRPITVADLPELAGEELCGIWLVCADKDIVLHAPTKSEWHRQQIILHEFSHMILDHDLECGSSELVKSLLPDLDAEQVLRALARSSYTDDAELTAEALADQLATRIINSDAGTPPEPLAFRKVFG